MTWVVAISGFPSGGVAAADVRITLDYGGRREYPEDVGVQKIHAVTRHVAVGFSGGHSPRV